MISLITRVDTAHRDMIHDAQMDFYGTRLATCSSDRTVKVFEIKPNGQQIFIADLLGHEGPVWQVAWAHPMYGGLLASCSYDRRIMVWKETAGKWSKLYEYTQHEASVNSICWAPSEYGLILAAASSDGTLSIIFATGDGTWEAKKIPNAHSIGCNAVSWAPATTPGSLVDPSQQPMLAKKRIVSGGCDKFVKIWKEENDQWVEEHKLEGHKDWVRDVAWAPCIGLPNSLIASCSHDARVLIWRCGSLDEDKWTCSLLHTFEDVVWHVSWSLCGSILAVSGGDNKISLWKQSLEDQWTCISDSARNESTPGDTTRG